MIGSDIVTVRHVLENDNDLYVIEDRYVPWSAYAPSPFPELDKYNNWYLDCVETDESMFSVVLHRSLNTGDGQDREIVSGFRHDIIYAWGSSDVVSYHSHNRGYGSVIFFGGDVDVVPTIPEDANGAVILTYFPRYFSKGIETQYICQGFDLGEQARHVVQFEALTQRLSSDIEANHMLVHGCGDDPNGYYFDLFRHKPINCAIGSQGGDSLLGIDGCQLLYAWAVGGEIFTMPKDVGLRIGAGSHRYIIIETHLNNPNNVNGLAPAKLGVRMQTTTMLREFDAAVLTIGDVSLSYASKGPFPLGVSDIHYESTCSSACTSNFLGDLTVFGSFPHMHSYGRKIWTTISKFNEDSDVVLSMDILEYRQFWNFNMQRVSPTNAVISKGDRINTHCVYDTSKAESTVRFGLSSDNEMCFHFLFVYPASHLTANYCGRSQGGYSLCSNSIAQDSNLICKNNPNPDGTTDIPEALRFGEARNSSIHINRKVSAHMIDRTADEYELSQVTCRLYRFKETHLRNMRLGAAAGVTAVLISFCVLSALFVYCYGERKERAAVDFESIGAKLSEVVSSPQRNQYEMVSLEEEKNAFDGTKSV